MGWGVATGLPLSYQFGLLTKNVISQTPRRTLDIMRATQQRAVNRSRGQSTPGLSGSGARGTSSAQAAVAAAALAAHGGGGDDDAQSVGSACTADEDAFDVVEAFDEGKACMRGWHQLHRAWGVECPRRPVTARQADGAEVLSITAWSG